VNKNPKISIITVTFNSEKTIKETIESVFFQDYNNVEHIIIDGKSTDETIEIVKSYGDKISYFISEEDDGLYDAMNKGIRAASGDVVGILNSDDVYYTNHVISDVAEVFIFNNVESVYGDLLYVDTIDTDNIRRYWKSGHFKLNNMRKGWTIPHPTLFVKKEIYNKFGLYSIRLKSASDYEMSLRLLYKNKISITYLPKIMVKMRIGGISNYSIWNRLRGNNEDAVSWKMNGFHPPLFIRIRKPLSKLNQFFKRPNKDA
tara:strand:+ start:319 stop:1095 length:777 start_codon:yes stop_codon:yes gene_type:complete